MANRSKPVRIFVEDDSALEDLTRLLRRSRAEDVHEALAEYLVHHREELTHLYEQTQRAIATGDFAALARASAGARQAEVDAFTANVPAQCRLPWTARASLGYRGRLSPRAGEAGLHDL